jgi:hypothetical protein
MSLQSLEVTSYSRRLLHRLESHQRAKAEWVPAAVNFFDQAEPVAAGGENGPRFRYGALVRPILLLSFLTVLSASPAGAQSVIPSLEPAPTGPNARAAQRVLGPNASVMQRTPGPNAALVPPEKRASGQVHYPSCAAAGVTRPTPIRRGEPGYGRHLDPDGDGIACD